MLTLHRVEINKLFLNNCLSLLLKGMPRPTVGSAGAGGCEAARPVL